MPGDAFTLLLLAHLVADFPLQPFSLLRWKLTDVRGLLVHVGIQGALALPLLVWLTPAWPLWWTVLVGTHFVIDLAKVRVGGAGWTEVAVFLLDQALHLAVLWAIVGLSGAALLLPAAAGAALRVAVAVVVAAYAGAVVAFLVEQALRGGGQAFAPIPARERWWGMAERTGIVGLAVFLPGLWVVVSLAYLVAVALRRREDRSGWWKSTVSVGWALVVALVVLS